MHRCAPRAASQGGSVWRRAEGPVNTTIQPPLRGAGELLSRVTNKTLPADMRGILKNSFFCVCVCVCVSSSLNMISDSDLLNKMQCSEYRQQDFCVYPRKTDLDT